MHTITTTYSLSGWAASQPWSVSAPHPLSHGEWCVKKADPERVISYLPARGAAAIYEGMVFANWQYGQAFNAHIVPAFRLMNIECHTDAARLVCLFNHEMGKWLAARGAPHTYVYVHENSRDRGFHTHLIAHVPGWMKKEFKKWARECFSRLAERSLLSEEAFHVEVEHRYKVYSRLEVQWHWFRYITKSLDPRARMKFYTRPKPVKAVDVFGIKKTQPSGEIFCQRRYGVSTNINKEARRGVFRSALAREDFNEMFSGDELISYDERMRQKKMQEDIQEFLRSSW